MVVLVVWVEFGVVFTGQIMDVEATYPTWSELWASPPPLGCFVYFATLNCGEVVETVTVLIVFL